MEAVKKTQNDTKSKINFIGKAWKNTVNNEESKAHGKEYINIAIDREYESVNIKQCESIQLWPNTKREGMKDADYRVSVVSNEK